LGLTLLPKRKSATSRRGSRNGTNREVLVASPMPSLCLGTRPRSAISTSARAALAFAHNEQRFDADGVAAPSVEAVTISRSRLRAPVAALGQTGSRDWRRLLVTAPRAKERPSLRLSAGLPRRGLRNATPANERTDRAGSRVAQANPLVRRGAYRSGRGHRKVAEAVPARAVANRQKRSRRHHHRRDPSRGKPLVP
jgi:hypothetical protein